MCVCVCRYTYIFFFRFISIIVCYKILNIVPCAIWFIFLFSLADMVTGSELMLGKYLLNE